MGSYGTWDRFYRIGVEGTQNTIEAATKAKVSRFIHLSSMTVYGTRPGSVRISEVLPCDNEPQRWNHYVRQKVLSEQLVWKAHYQGRISATALRPSLVLGPGDRNVVGRTLRFIRSPFRGLIGDGSNWVACVLVEELARTIVRCASLPLTEGKAYNLSGANPITQFEYLNFHASAAGLSPIRRKMPLNLMRVGCGVMERFYSFLGREEEPFCTRIATELISTHVDVDCSLAAKDLDWVGEGSYEEAIRLSVEWYLKHEQFVCH
jgi:2-alkyl-3-oxoalkanoate reductase